LKETNVRDISKQNCLDWATKYKGSATAFNNTALVLRKVFGIAVESGIIYDNPARHIKRRAVRPKELHLPDNAEFIQFVQEIENAGGRFSKHCADLVRFLAYGGFRLGEAKNITWNDCDFKRGEIIVRGDAVEKTKNSEIRRVPMIAEMRQLLEKFCQERPDEPATARITKVTQCELAMERAEKKAGIAHLTHHDLRHLFATRCIESGVDIPTVSRWLGHKDGGALAMKTYGHLRDEHSTSMAQKVVFSENSAPKIVPFNESDSTESAKAIPQAKAKYSYPWWASSKPLEIFWGQANEPVQIVPTPKYLESAKAAMEREVFEQELSEPQTLLEELAARVDASVIEKLKTKILVGQKQKAA
jgi:integrase